MSRRLWLTVFAFACAAVMAAAAAAQTTSSQTSVSPHRGWMKTRFEVSFKAPESTSSTIHYNVEASNSKTAGNCVSQIGLPVDSATGGSMVHVKLNPKNAGGKWCKGRFKGQIQEIITTSCSCGPPVASADRSGSAAVVCPAIPCPKAAGPANAHSAAVTTETIGTFSFRVRKRSHHHH